MIQCRNSEFKILNLRFEIFFSHVLLIKRPHCLKAFPQGGKAHFLIQNYDFRIKEQEL
jgi:hypothetical protein